MHIYIHTKKTHTSFVIHNFHFDFYKNFNNHNHLFLCKISLLIHGIPQKSIFLYVFDHSVE